MELNGPGEFFKFTGNGFFLKFGFLRTVGVGHIDRLKISVFVLKPIATKNHFSFLSIHSCCKSAFASTWRSV